MSFWDYSRTLGDHHRDPFPRSLLRTRKLRNPTRVLGFRAQGVQGI